MSKSTSIRKEGNIMNTTLTQAAKEDLYKRCNYIILTLNYICGGKALHMQLIKLLEEMNLPHMTQLKIKSDITELIKAGFLKKKQVLNTNANVLILTAYPLSVLLSVPSANVSEIASSRKSILEGICRIEFIINELHKYRQIHKTNAPFTVEKIVEFMDWRNSTVCCPLKSINLYLERMSQKYDNLNLLSQDFLDDYHYLEVIRMQKANALSKTDIYDIDPEWIKIKEDYFSLQETMSAELQNRSLYNIYNMKNSSCDINHWVIKEDGRYYIKINLYDNGNLTLDRITSLTSYIFLMFAKYCIHFDRPMLYVHVLCSSEEVQKGLEEEASKRIPTYYGMRDATLATQGLVSSGIRIQYIENISLQFINLNISDNYNIYYY